MTNGTRAGNGSRPIERKQRQFEGEALVHLDVLYGVALRLTGGDVARADDLVQDAFLHAYRAWSSYRPGSNCRAWLMRILRNLFFDDCRRQVRFARDLELETVPNLLAVEPFRERDPESRFLYGPLSDEVRKAIDALPPAYRETLVLSDLMNLTYAEIGEETGVPVGTVKSRLFRARKMLQEALSDYALAMGYRSATGDFEPLDATA